ncbi:MAG: hypothetical protein JWO36_6849 [Myxococcales bacterium]|nr:hypothetical protein [Myxococcales bacterium]
MRLAILTVSMLALGGCSGCGNDQQLQADAGVDAPTFDQCTGDPATFVRQAFLALDGRRPKSQAEVDVYVAVYKEAEAKGFDAKDTVSRAIMARPEFEGRWVDVFMDAMHVQRTDIQSESGCWDKGLRAQPATPALAMTIRTQRATGTGDGQTWNMVDLARSALALDDITPVYRAQLFSLVANPIPAANVNAVESELARRADFGATFDAGYLHRNGVCLGCHNSEMSVTDSDDPAKDRFWPVPGSPEKSVYGMSTGVADERAHAMFRYDGFADNRNATNRPWGWSGSCGVFNPRTSVPTDPANVDAKLASITGKTSTVHDLEAALGRGFDALRGMAPPIQADGSIADPDTALAWLVTLKMTEDVWKQATGTSLTIANYFPRNQAASDLLYALATKFTQSGYSVKALLAAIVASDYFDRKTADAGCGATPYTYPNVFDPWVISDPDPAKHLNGPGDAVAAVDARTLVSAINAALEWTPHASARFPDSGSFQCLQLSCSQLQNACSGNQCCNEFQGVCTELPFARGVGIFLRNSERGFRGVDFQARLAFENRYGACARPKWVTLDFIDKLVVAGAADPSATAADVVSALKDRLIGEPTLTDQPERDALAAFVGSLDAPASGVQATAVRQVCGALLGTPQFLLQGIAGKGGDLPKLTPPDAGFDAICADLAARGAAGHSITCSTGTLTLQ